MDEKEYVSLAMHNEFAARMQVENKRLEDENDRQNHRLDSLEEGNKQINNLALSIQDLTSSVKTIAKETERLSTMMKENINGMDARLKKLESADGDKWKGLISHAGTVVLGIIIAFLFQYFLGIG